MSYQQQSTYDPPMIPDSQMYPPPQQPGMYPPPVQPGMYPPPQQPGMYPPPVQPVYQAPIEEPKKKKSSSSSSSSSDEKEKRQFERSNFLFVLGIFFPLLQWINWMCIFRKPRSDRVRAKRTIMIIFSFVETLMCTGPLIFIIFVVVMVTTMNATSDI
ncbi:hypothetical protein EHI8A_047580 [Entamoeba histolytica HM-1:IMSS-B]|uniref:Uncharacterized protein n=6 Tax=Entamoeba histolytica TaxID=5759 RepID=C4M8L7_ENTH1|nr:hypothetical protein EHI_090410 [Entamoeba histolytica HM-1:IMSS]EMD44012.1 Hypothetical protein EHI5A_078640 [Entamoeba histolytica KU27]EMH77748.1 hypothetical protein EHI8A_047580 [Entamoeba histolytica HM-1:IMSS-B]ENY65959.1 hypothetical protein EHI7A_047880 [Entamoeba histolytica HM-1:IMSS-A]GAT97954.1 hypothetical protein CL6EHI_090410 [Entamoeba histolytica]EAL44625.1 hypothetical protein EHI_090410 [Entamoeba histolytica HM-1:IMSS]|eukprot:XP_650011.1 hypothetical protein EHI_090410 [Entamoeba histolytica HM-1:IMSS]